VELAPQLAEAHASRGLALSLNRGFDEAEEEFQTAMRLDPKSFEAAYFYARACAAQGKAEESTKWYERAVAVRPDDFATFGLLADTYNGLGNTEECIRAARRGYDAARKHLELNPDNPRALYMGAACLSFLGESEKSRDWNRRALSMEPDDPSVLYNIACNFAMEGQVPEAITTLSKALDRGFGHWKWLEHDSSLDPLRSEPGFQQLLARKPPDLATTNA
jgi:adenylate cyclase